MPASAPPLVFRQDINRAAAIFVTAVVTLFACMFLLGFFSRLSYLGADAWFLGILGTTLLVLDIFMIRYFIRPGFVLSEFEMRANGFFRDYRIRYADLKSLSAYLEKVHQPLIRGTRMPPRIVHRLLVKTRDERALRLTLMSFGYNAAFIEALEMRTGITVERLADRESKPRW